MKLNRTIEYNICIEIKRHKHIQSLQAFNLSQDQETALTMLETFLASPVQVFMLKGYEGSGKTTILKGLVEYLNSTEKDFALMAPTVECKFRTMVTHHSGDVDPPLFSKK